jgi:heptaprenyl diphosphate synthase
MTELRELVTLPHIWEDIARLEERLFEATTSDHRYLTEISQHLLEAGGKRYRPLLALLCAEFGPHRDHRAVEAGVSVELIHVGSLYHDDVIDEADTRRGAQSVNANWDNTVAILAGDYLMARASETAATHLSQEAVRLLAATYAELVEGQTRELTLDYDVDHEIADYERVIYLKTASLIRTSARLGAMSSDTAEPELAAVSTWASEVGMVFQVADDVLDLVATSDVLGKPAGSDIREGKFTMPVLLALNGTEGDRVRKLLTEERPYGDAAVEEIIDIVRAGGYAAATLDSARRRLRVAEDALQALPDIEAKDVLSRLGRYLVDRVANINA